MKEKDSYTVYKHVNRLNGKQYIGITKQIASQRWGKDGINYKSSPRFWNAIQKYGWDNFDHIILETGLTQKEACEKEISLIEENRTQEKLFGYNSNSGGTTPIMSKEAREKLSNSMKGNKNGFGKSCSDDKKEKIRTKLLGKPFTEEHRKNISKAKKGSHHKPISQESRKKIADKHKKKKVYCLETDTIYESIQECARQLNLPATNIAACCKGKHKHTKGFHFNYYNEEKPND